MGRKKKSSNGNFRQTFTYNGKRYSVYAKDQNELTDKILAKKKELEELKENRTNPTIQAYYEEFTEIRRREIKEATIRGQIYQFRNITEVVMQDGIKFGKMRIRDITRRDIEYARQSLLKEGKTPEYLNIVFAHLNHVLETATLDETIDRNPCKALKRLKRENQPISETKHRALTEDETCSFLVCKASVRGSYAYAMPPSPDAIASVDVAASPYTSASIFTRLRASSHSENQSVCAWLIGRAISRSIKA